MVFSRCLTYGDQFLFRFELQLHMYIYILLIHGFMIFVWTMFIWFWWGSDIIIYISIWSWGKFTLTFLYTFQLSSFIHDVTSVYLKELAELLLEHHAATRCTFFQVKLGDFFGWWWSQITGSLFFEYWSDLGWWYPTRLLQMVFFQKFEALPVDVGWALEICDIKESERKGSFFKYFAILLWVEKTWCVFFLRAFLAFLEIRVGTVQCFSQISTCTKNPRIWPLPTMLVIVQKS